MTDVEAALLWLYMAETWPVYNIPSDTDQRAVRLEVWADQLGDLEAQQVRAAIAALADSEFPPPVGRIREKAVELARQQSGKREPPDADEAWRVVFEYASGRIRDDNVRDLETLAHPAVAQACRTIGWDEIRYSETPHFVRRNFLQVYGTSAERYRRESLLPAPVVLAFVKAQGAAIKRADDVLGIGVGADG